MDILIILQNFALKILTNIFGSESFITNFGNNHPLMVLFLMFILPLIIFGGLSIFLDFIVDAWKMPFGIALDIITYLSYVSFNLIYIPLILGPAIFYILLSRKNKLLAIITSIISFFSTLAIIIFQSNPMINLLVIIPVNTILMFIGCILD